MGSVKQVGICPSARPGQAFGIHPHLTDPSGGILEDYARGDLYFTRKAGVVNYEAWYSHAKTNIGLGSSAIVSGRLYAYPFIVPRQIKLDRIGIKVGSTVANFFRAGIYKDDGNLYPKELIVDSGELPETTGLQVANISITIDPPLVWLAILSGGVPNMATFTPTNGLNILGHEATLTNTIIGLYHAQAYGALPATFPSAAPTKNLETGLAFAIMVRLAV